MKKLTVCITAILSAMLLMSCQTTKTEYIEKPFIPEITFPVFPVLTEYERKDGKVIVSEDWIVRLAEYKIYIEETKKDYNDLKALYEGGDEK